MISLVVPIYNEEEIVGPLVDQITAAMESLLPPKDWEAVFVDDGSSDRTLALLLERRQTDRRLAVLQLSRNWGHQAAISAGLKHSKGDAVIVMDGDLQDPPSVIPQLIGAWCSGARVVIAQRTGRHDGWLSNLFVRAFYFVLGQVSDYPIPLNAGIFGLLDRQAVEAVNELDERNRYLPGLRAWIGFPAKVIFYDRPARAGGKPKQNFTRLARYAFDAIFSFSYKPLRFSLVMGVATAIFAMVFAVVLVSARLRGVGILGGPVVVGYTSTIVSILFLGGIQLIGIGILGEYLGRIYDEVKRRPLYLVQQVYGTGDSPDGDELSSIK
ncbi:MAG TPA: glycosyltransferase family 2 protein [Bryobacteraceae bacterium]|jgi:dolichol-phosphate mannosyltransferase